MIIKSRKQLPLLTSDSETVLPVLAIRSGIIFPGDIHTIQVGRKENLLLLENSAKQANEVILSFAPQIGKSADDMSLSQVGVLARIQSIKPAMSNSRMVTLEGLRRVALMDIKQTEPYVEASIAEVQDRPGAKTRLQKYTSEILNLVESLIRLDDRYTNELVYTLEMNSSHPGKLADRTASMIHLQLSDKQEILEAVVPQERLQILIRLLNDEIEKLSLSVQINSRTAESLERKKREVFLRQQLMEIRRELGEDFVEEDIAKIYQNRIKGTQALSQEVYERLIFEADRLKHLSSSSNEYGVTKNYLELLLSLPWENKPENGYDLVEVEKIMDTEYYGSSRVKDQVLEYLAVRQMSNEYQDLPIMCLTGPVGTGKASLVKAIAKATNRQFVRINGTSLVMMEDIKGMPRTSIGAGPGQLVKTIRRSGSFNLVVFLEDLEYVVESEDINAILSLLEAIDPRQNSHFVDNFVGVPLDFSRILFVLGLSYIDEFPEPFMHRLELVEMPGYIEREKIAIAKRHIIPKLHKRHGLNRKELKFSEKALSFIIRFYTMEAGLVGMQQQLEKIFRKIARKKASSETCRYSIIESNIDQYLGTPQYIPEKATPRPEIGVAIGLAWTGAGGDLMLIEGLKMRGTGQVIYTGSLGDVMKESVQAAHSFVRARADSLGIDHNDFVNFDIHIHFPMGAIPKDGPSAGVTVSLVVASVMAERPIRNDIAMTGEVTLRGKVLSVGGIKEKVSAAYRAGIKNIILPKENEKDVKNIPREITKKTNFIFIESVDGLFEQALLEFTPSTYTLEKIFAAEIEKAKKRNEKGSKRKATKKPTRKKTKK